MTSPDLPHPSPVNRREFLRTGSRAALLAGAVTTAGSWGGPVGWGQAVPRSFDARRYEQTDPALVRYREVRRFSCGRGEVRRLALGPDGRLWVAAGQYLCAFDDAGNVVAEQAFADPVRCVAASGDGELFVGFRDRIEVLAAPGRSPRAVWPGPAARTWFTRLAVGKEGVFAADSGQRVVWHFDGSGQVKGRLGEKDADRGIPGLVLPSPYLDVVVHPDGLLRVNNSGRHRVEAYTVAGDLAAWWGKPGMGIEGFCGCCNPVGLAVLPDGRMVTCEKGLPRVKIYGVRGDFEGVVAGVEAFTENARVSTGDRPGDGVKASLDVVADREGRVYVLDTVAAEIRLLVPKDAG